MMEPWHDLQSRAEPMAGPPLTSPQSGPCNFGDFRDCHASEGFPGALSQVQLGLQPST